MCGQVRYQLTALPTGVAVCHCTDCQKQSGSAFSINLVMLLDAFELTGLLSNYESLSSSGNLMQRRFCAKCGSPILSQIVEWPALCFVKAGTLDDVSAVQPQLQMWCDSAQPWLAFDPPLPSFPKAPTG